MYKQESDVLEIVGASSIFYQPGQSILEAAKAAGVVFCHECGGKARCTTCRVMVAEGRKQLSQPEEKEQHMMRIAGIEPPVRLACQARLNGGRVKVSRIFKDETDYMLYLGQRQPHNEQEMGKEMEMALLFIDIRNFTRFIKHHLPFDAMHLIRKLFTVFGHEVHLQGGRIIETAGDSLYIAFGFNQQNLEQSSNNGLLAGYNILMRLQQLNKEYFNDLFHEQIQIGMGLHVGKVVVGKIIIENDTHQVVMGYPVNVAARLEALTKELNNNFIVSEDAYNLFRHKPDGQYHLQPIRGTNTCWKIYSIGESYN